MQGLPYYEHPETSVILPAYNRAALLPACIGSVTGQTYRDWELVIVDDGSADDTYRTVLPFLSEHSNIRYIRQSHRGTAFAKNLGIQASFGRFLTFIDSDDQYLPDHLQFRAEFMRMHPEIDLMEGGFQAREETWVNDYFDHSRMIPIEACVLCGTFYGRRHVFAELEGFRPVPYGDDTDLWLRAEGRFNTVKISGPKTYLYTRAGDSLTKNFKPAPSGSRERHPENNFHPTL